MVTFFSSASATLPSEVAHGALVAQIFVAAARDERYWSVQIRFTPNKRIFSKSAREGGKLKYTAVAGGGHGGSRWVRRDETNDNWDAEAERARRMGSTPQVKPRALLVDLDGTLYRSAKLFDDVRERINGE